VKREVSQGKGNKGNQHPTPPTRSAIDFIRIKIVEQNFWVRYIRFQPSLSKGLVH